MSCPAPELLEGYVLGTVEGDSATNLESHVAACAACGEALAREARLELGLEVVATLPSRSRRRTRVAVASGMAMAAAAALVLVSVLGHAPQADAAPRVRRCDAVEAGQDCVARGRFDGVLTIGPGREVIVPRYDEGRTP